MKLQNEIAKQVRNYIKTKWAIPSYYMHTNVRKNDLKIKVARWFFLPEQYNEVISDISKINESLRVEKTFQCDETNDNRIELAIIVPN